MSKTQFRGGLFLREYHIIPEFRYSKAYPYVAFTCLLIAVGLIFFGYFVTSAGFILAICFCFCSIYYASLLFCNKYYRLHITPGITTVWNIFNRSRSYQTDTLRWKIVRIPWYNTYFVLLYSTGKKPVAIIKPHWENMYKLLAYPHHGKLSDTERKYIKFLKHTHLMH